MSKKKPLTLTTFLLRELMVDIDASDPAKAQAEVRRMAQIAKASPARANREMAAKAKDEKNKIAADGDSPTKTIDLQIVRLKQQLATLMQRREQILKQTQTAATTPTQGTV